MEAMYKVQFNTKLLMEKAQINFKKTPKERLTKTYVETRLESLEALWSDFTATHKSIIQAVSDSQQKSDKYFVNEVYDASEENYILHKTQLKDVLKSFSKHNSDESLGTKNVDHPTSSSVRLPKINIPQFSGNYAEWTTFKDLFTSLIHNNSNLEDVQKLHYLKGLLSGEADQLVKHIAVTADNYKECWSLLNSRFNNKRFLANCLLKRLLSQNTATECSNSLKALLDTTTECLNGLKNLGVDVSTWDIIIVYIISDKLDHESRKLWETQISTQDKLPLLSEFRDFLAARFRALEFLGSKSSKPKAKVHHVATDNKVLETVCPFCKESHKIHNCKKFAQESYESRQSFAQTRRLCYNCLNANHSIKFCRQTASCRICKRRHHSLLHPTSVSNSTGVNEKSNAEADVKSAVSSVQASLSVSEPSTSKVVTHFSKGSVPSQVLLATALVEAQTRSGSTQLLRVLLDQGSQASFIAESAVQLLGLRKKPIKSVISGIGGERSAFASKYTVTVNIHSRVDPKFSAQVHAFVLGTITSSLPSEKLEQSHWPELREITLADPEFHTPNKIDILLGAEVYGQVLRDGLIQGPPNYPVAQNTALGWILSGQILSNRDSIHCHHVIQSSLDQADDNAILRQFWEIESTIPSKKILSDEEKRCEDIYANTTHRDEEGRYVVHLPFRDQDPQCQYGGSRALALKRFHLLENKFKKNPTIKARYSEVFQEYIDLGHMEPVHGDDITRTAVYLPHHAVVREDKTTTKVRIVFDASMKGLNGVSMNDDLMIGPMLQPPLRHIIMRWKMHPISLCADIIKMYRQVKVSPEHAEFQRVVWREDPESEIKEYKLVRVTFGTAAAPYLAVKSLQQVAVDEGGSCPEVSEIIKNQFYVDDLMTGCQTVEEGLHIYKKITELLTKGQFQLQKWVSSCDELNRRIQGDTATKARQLDEEQYGQEKDIKLDSVIKILGISWDRERDVFKYSVQLDPQQSPVTKRKVIADIARLFDPLGWVAPCIVTAKIFIQKLWLAGLEWDEELTPELLSEWETYRLSLVDMNKFSIPRWVNTKSDDLLLELHGFCDASIAAYAAVVYVRVIDANKTIHVDLITARTKVAPIKQQSVPRLELMGAVLLSELISEVAEVMKVAPPQIHTWTDSSVVLAWLSKHPSHWTTFVGNRVSTILSHVDNSHWAHVQSAHNPADLASRGLTPQELVGSSLWSQGPSWLRDETIEYTRPKSISTSTEQRSIKVHVATEPLQENPVWTKFSSLQRLVRVVAYCRRVLSWKKLPHSVKRVEGYLTKEEIQEATKSCIKLVQKQEFLEEIEDIKKKGSVKGRSKLKSLCPVVDDDGILRVSGRIQNAEVDEDVKHPIILPANNHFTNLVIDDSHKRTLHGGLTLMLSQLRTKYWILSAKAKIKAHVHKCVKCRRYSASIQTPLMGQLPSSRVTPARPFLNSGVDFAGPISIRTSKGRGHQSYKGYICVFVCMVTKAIHLEAISDLTSQGFIAGFKRFVARRGFVSDIWSDNGTNFVGASKELKHLVSAEKSSVAGEIKEWLGTNSTSWHFIPPHSPNFGGLWEAGVKSTKFHLKRVIGNSTLTFEEISTVLTQIEACLNSRPLSMMPDSCTDPTPLTPGHFLIGEPLIAVPERNYEESNVSNLRRWQITQRMVQDFWRRWSDEYLVQLLQRHKWTKNIPEPSIGDVVLVKEDNLPPARWLLGKVMDKHPGLDKVTRVVTLKCNGSLIKRPISKLCILPIEK